MRHNPQRDFITGKIACTQCGKEFDLLGDGGQNTVDALFHEQCSGEKQKHDWAQPAGERGYLLSPVCSKCGKSQRDVHPHSACQAAVLSDAAEPVGGRQASLGDAIRNTVEMQAAAVLNGTPVERERQISAERIAEIGRAIETADAANAFGTAGMVIMPTAELRVLLDAYEAAV